MRVWPRGSPDPALLEFSRSSPWSTKDRGGWVPHSGAATWNPRSCPDILTDRGHTRCQLCTALNPESPLPPHSHSPAPGAAQRTWKQLWGFAVCSTVEAAGSFPGSGRQRCWLCSSPHRLTHTGHTPHPSQTEAQGTLQSSIQTRSSAGIKMKGTTESPSK